MPLQAVEQREDGVHTLPVPGFATVRTHPFNGAPEALGVVGSSYTPIQNEEHAEFLNHLTDQSGAVFDTAGSLRGGRQIFVTMQLRESMNVGGTDRVDLLIAALNSHDGSSAFRVLVTPVRVVCANTQAAALNNHVSSISIRHTASARAAVQAARDVLGLTFAYCDAFQAEAEQLLETAMTDAAFDGLITRVFGPTDANAPTRTPRAESKRRRTLAALFADSQTQANIRGSAWAGYQAVTEYVDHFAPVRDKNDAATARATHPSLNDSHERTGPSHDGAGPFVILADFTLRAVVVRAGDATGPVPP